MIEALNKPNMQAELIKLRERRSEYLDYDTVSDTKPVSPVGEITSTKVGIRTAFGTLRWMFLLPWLLGAGISLFWLLEDVYLTWKSTENTHLKEIAYLTDKYGEDYFKNTTNIIDIKRYNRINEDGEMPLLEYLDIRYRDSYKAEHRLRGDIIFGAIYIVAILVLLTSILSFHRRAPLYFDRSRKIVYTWRKGYVWAQYYDELWLYQGRQSMDIVVYGFDKKGRFKLRPFVVMPTGNPFMNGETVYRPVLAFITQFMEYGRDAVFDRDWEGRRGWYLFDDKKPEDFNEQLESVLKYIKTERVNEAADQLGDEWGRLNNGKAE